jgi:hypothetical protein
MNPFTHALAQQLGAPSQEISSTRPKHDWTKTITTPVTYPLAGSLAAKILDHLRLHPNQDVQQIRDALDTDPYGRIYNALQSLRRGNAIEQANRIGNRIIWRAKV